MYIRDRSRSVLQSVEWKNQIRSYERRLKAINGKRRLLMSRVQTHEPFFLLSSTTSSLTRWRVCFRVFNSKNGTVTQTARWRSNNNTSTFAVVPYHL